MKRSFSWLLRLALLAIAVAFCVVNRDDMTVSFYPLPYEVALPKFLFALLVFTLGLLAGSTLNSLRLIKAKRSLKERERKIAAQENELSGLRTDARQFEKPKPAAFL